MGDKTEQIHKDLRKGIPCRKISNHKGTDMGMKRLNKMTDPEEECDEGGTDCAGLFEIPYQF